MLRRLLTFARATSATSATEFALILPVLLALIAGIVEIGRAFQVYDAVNRTATRYAISWADCSDTVVGVCQTELALYVTPAAISNVAPQLTNTLSLRMMEVSMSGTSATVVYAYPVGATPTAAELKLAQSVIGSGNTGVIVTASYTHTLLFFSTLMSQALGASRQITYSIAQRKA